MARSKKRFKRGYRERKTSSERTRMLDLKREPYFKYDLNELMNNANIEEKYIDSMQATILMKAGKNSIDDAKAYLDDKCKEGIIDEQTRDEIKYLLDKYKRHR